MSIVFVPCVVFGSYLSMYTFNLFFFLDPMTDEEYFVGHCNIGWEKKTVALRTFYKLDLAGTYIINIFKSLFRFFFFSVFSFKFSFNWKQF